MINSIYRALWEWFMQCQGITKLFFNFSTATDSDTVITTAGDTLLKEYIDGAQLRRYAFELSRFCPATTIKNDPGNIEMLEDAEAIAHWVQQQNDAGFLPELPAGSIAQEIYVLDEFTGYAISQDENTAKYMIPFAIEYLKEKEG